MIEEIIKDLQNAQSWLYIKLQIVSEEEKEAILKEIQELEEKLDMWRNALVEEEEK